MTFGHKIKTLREEYNMSQVELAKQLKITSRTLQNYESGRCYPKSQEIILKLCAVFNKDAQYFLSLEDEFINDAKEQYGIKGKRQAQQLISQTTALFAGGDLEEEDKEAFFQAITEIYFDSKKRAKKHTPKKHVKE